ncbi:hypothetical protein SAMN05444172_2335 [Burkholderia sp. GAS332]|nr:hypothetical protein SAMN05444172_2335 [Burkholderia sp. GAS332]
MLGSRGTEDRRLCRRHGQRSARATAVTVSREHHVFPRGVGDRVAMTAVNLLNTHGCMLSFPATAAYRFSWRANRGTENYPTLHGRHYGGDRGDSAAGKIKSEAWIVDALCHEQLKANNDLCRPMLQGRRKAVIHVVEDFEKLPDAIVGLYRAGRSDSGRLDLITQAISRLAKASFISTR